MRANIIGKLKYFRYLYLMLFGAILYYILFNYMPMYGATLAFREFQYNSTIFQAPWVGFKYFKQLFSLADYWNAFKNTILISFGRLLVEFPVPIILAVLLNEIRGSKLKRFYQTIYTFPHFLSWVLIVGILNTMLLSDGLINSIIISFSGKPIGFLTTPSLFRPILYATSLWKEIGWNSIIYLAALTSIDPELYQAAKVDGANRFQQMTYITLPGIMDTILVMLLIFIGNFLRHGNFDQVFNMYNSTVYSVGDIVDTYIYRSTFVQGINYSLSTAAGLFSTSVNLILLLIANKVVTLFGRPGIF